MNLLHRSGMAALLFAMVWIGCDKDDDNQAEPNSLSAADTLFMMKASRANRAEIELGELAAGKGSHSAVKEFGQHMVMDHNTAWRELDSLADRWNIDLPRDLDSLHQAKKQMLSGMSGYAFDTAYLHSQVKDHLDAIALYENAATGSREPKLKNYAGKYLPHLRHHKQKVDSILAIID